MQSRRGFLISASAAGAAGFLARPLAAELPPETTTVRLHRTPSLCVAPQHVADDLLRAEGFRDIRHVAVDMIAMKSAVARGELDFGVEFAAPLVASIDAAVPITVLAGVHVGCFELFGGETIGRIGDLRGKSVGVQALGSPQHAFLSVMAAHVGLDPRTDINWVTSDSPRPMALYADGKIDAFLGFPPEPQELRARKIGHVIVNSAVDRPWSQYFCCMLIANREFVRRHPSATKRVTRAILKAADLCASDPERVAQRMVEQGFTRRQDYALQTLTDIPYGRWRDYDPEDTLRFYALRLHEAGMIKASPKKIIADGADWRFLNELKRELKG